MEIIFITNSYYEVSTKGFYLKYHIINQLYLIWPKKEKSDKIKADINPAIQSSVIMPLDPLNFSAFLIIPGFTISRNLNKIKAIILNKNDVPAAADAIS